MEDLVNAPPAFGGVFAGRRVLVTGHTGFKGAWVSIWLMQLGAEVCGFSRDVPTSPSLYDMAGLRTRMRDETGDIRDQERLSTLIAEFRPDFVIHMAAQAIVSQSYTDPVETVSSNVLGTACVLQALRQVKTPCTAIIVASDKCYENLEWTWGYRENDRLGGKDVYSASKGAAEIIFDSFQRSFFSAPDSVVRLATVRAGNVIGGGDWAKDRIVADCIRAWDTGEVVKVRSPSAIRPWQHVLEPLSGYLALAQALHHGRHAGESFNFGPRSERSHTVLQLLTDLARAWDPGQPAGVEVTADIPFHEATVLKLNCDKAATRLRWEPTLSYEEGVAMTGAWYREVMRNARDPWAAIVDQIGAYENLAAERGRAWRMPPLSPAA